MRFLDLVRRDIAWASCSLGISPKVTLRTSLVLLTTLFFAACSSFAQDVRTYVPTGALTLAPTLVQVQSQYWPGAPDPWTLAGQVEQESCITLKHSRCWSPTAELKTSREYGFGLGQITTAYRPDGSVRFNKFEELKAQHRELRGWDWSERYRADYQLTAIVLMTRDLHKRVDGAATPLDRWAFTLSAYNGGMGGVLQDRLLCSNSSGCDPSRWFGHVERTSLKTRKVHQGYGKSAFEINREYPQLILFLRREKYRPFWS